MARCNPKAVATLGYRDGCTLGVHLLHELQEFEGRGETDPYSLDPLERKQGEPQDNAVLRYLRVARTAGTNVEAGFAAVLTDYLAAACAGGVRDPGSYEQAIGEQQ